METDYGCGNGYIHPAPSFVNIYFARMLDKLIMDLGMKYGKNDKSAFLIFKRFVDDIIRIFKGTTRLLHEIFE